MDKATLFLAHHGIKGMKWGVRKGGSSGPSEVKVKTGSTLTGKAKIKTSGGSKHPPHADAVAARVVQQKLARSGTHSLSNHEIQTLVNRHNLEQQVARVPKKSSAASKAGKHIANFLGSPAGKASLDAAHERVGNEKVKRAIQVTKALT